jgi:type I restriction enzyme R subunit
MIRHFASVVLPSGYKAQVVATSREAAITYQEKLCQARDTLVAEIEALPAAYDNLTDEQTEALPTGAKLLIRARPILLRIKALEIGAVFSGDHNDPESWREWSDRDKQEDRIRRFKKKFGLPRTEKTDPISILVVKNMRLTGFDAPVEQVLYLDRKIVAHDLLQAIARVNRTSGKKRCGYVVDYVGVARHLHEALSDYDEEDTRGALIDISIELPKLLDRRARAVAVFTNLGITDLKTQVPACVELLADLKIRADFINKLRAFYDQLNMLEHRPEVPGDVFRDAKLLGFYQQGGSQPLPRSLPQSRRGRRESKSPHQRSHLSPRRRSEDPTNHDNRRRVRKGLAGADEQPRPRGPDATRGTLPHHRLH